MTKVDDIKFNKYIDVHIPLKKFSIILNPITHYLVKDRKDILTCDMRIIENNLLNHCIGEINACCLALYILNEVKYYYNYYPVDKNFKKDILTVSIIYNNVGENLTADNNKKKISIIFSESSNEDNTVFAFVITLLPKTCITDDKYIYSNEYSINYITLFSKIINNVYKLIQKEIINICIIRNSSDYKPMSNNIVKKTYCYYIKGNPYDKITCTCTTRCQECAKIIGNFQKKDLIIMYDTIRANDYKRYNEDIFSKFITTLSNIPHDIIYRQEEKKIEKTYKRISHY